jgi:hypothetical protein
MGGDVGILWIFLAFLFFGILFVFFALGEFLTPKKSVITGKSRTPEEISKKGFTKGIVLFILAIFIFGILFGELSN